MNQAIKELENKGSAVKVASRRLAYLSTGVKNQALRSIASDLMAKQEEILAANRLDFQAGEVCTGGSRTNPKYGRLGLYTYTYSEIYQFLGENGRKRVRFSIERNNIPPQKAQAKLGARIYSEGRYLKLLWWEFWKEKPRRSGNDPCL